MSTLIRFEQSSNRSPSATLWGGLVDFVRGTLAAGNSVFIGRDHYNSGEITLSGDTGSAGTVAATKGGTWTETCDSAAEAVAGHLQNITIDLDNSMDVCTEARLSRTDDDATSEAFIGFTDEALDGFYGTDNTPDGSALGLRWNPDETVDLISIESDNTITTHIAEVATGVTRDGGFHTFGVRFTKQTTTKALLRAQVNGVEKKVVVLLSALPDDAMQPCVALHNDNESAPAAVFDWHFTVDKFTVS